MSEIRFRESTTQKVVRVHHNLLGIKYVLATKTFEDLIGAVKFKFLLPYDEEITLTDERGAEIDEDTYLAFLTFQNVLDFHLVRDGEGTLLDISNSNPSNVSSVVPIIASSTTSPPPPSSGHSQGVGSTAVRILPASQEKDVWVEVLKNLFENHPTHRDIAQRFMERESVSIDDQRALAKIACRKLQELKDWKAEPKDVRTLAFALIEVFPSWRYTRGEGIEHLCDPAHRSGLLQAVIRTIRKDGTPTNSPSTSQNRGTNSRTKRPAEQAKGGPPPKQLNTGLPLDVQDQVQEAIQQLKDCPYTTSKAEVDQLMTATFDHREAIRKVFIKVDGKDISQLHVEYPKFQVFPYLVELEYNLLYQQEKANLFLERWDELKLKQIEKATLISNSKPLKALIARREDLDENIFAFFFLLYLIPPTARGRANSARVSGVEAEKRIFQFFKTGTPRQYILDNWNNDVSLPCLVGRGNSPYQLQEFFIRVDGLLIPTDAVESKAGLDLLFKSHWVFHTAYDDNLFALWTFMQAYVYEIDNPHVPPKAKSVYTNLQLTF